MITIEFTKEELKSVLIQLGARVDELKKLQVEAGKKGDIDRVLEIEEFSKPFKSGYEKMTTEFYK